MNALAIRRGELDNRPELTGELFNLFVNYIDASPRTIESYTNSLKLFFIWIKAQGINKPTRGDILRYREELKANHKPTTVQAYIIAVRQFFKWSDQEGLYANISENIKGAKIEREHKKDALTSRQVKEILSSIDQGSLQGKRGYAILAIAVTAGLRTIELQRANIEDIRTVADSTVLFIQGKGKQEKSEYVKLPAPVEKAVRAYIKTRRTTTPRSPLFTSLSDRNSGGRLTTKSISRIIKKSFIKAGYDSDRLTAHSLRHTAGTLNLLNGGSLEETQQLLRHSDINTTLIYLHHIERANNQSEARIAGAIF